MKKDAQIIAVAEACGWSPCPLFANPAWTKHPSGLVGPFFFGLPDYLNSLDAMAEAEKALTDNQWDRYEADLWAIVAPGEIVQPSMPLRFARRFLSATAAQRAEAFLRTLNLWTDEPPSEI